MDLFLTQESFAMRRSLEDEGEETSLKCARQTFHQAIPNDIYTVILSFCPVKTLLDVRLSNLELWIPTFRVLFSRSNPKLSKIKGASW